LSHAGGPIPSRRKGASLMIDRVQGMESSWGPEAEEMKEAVLRYSAAAREQLAEGGERIKEYVVKEPLRAMGIALGMGVVLGWLIKRR